MSPIAWRLIKTRKSENYWDDSLEHKKARFDDQKSDRIVSRASEKVRT